MTTDLSCIVTEIPEDEPTAEDDPIQYEACWRTGRGEEHEHSVLIPIDLGNDEIAIHEFMKTQITPGETDIGYCVYFDDDPVHDQLFMGNIPAAGSTAERQPPPRPPPSAELAAMTAEELAAAEDKWRRQVAEWNEKPED
eukprot:SAG11_NODE_4741_length_1783_cov_176.024347_2_plen_140_part_00